MRGFTSSAATRRTHRRLATAGVATSILLASGLAAPSAQAAASKTLNYSCVFPFVDAQPLAATFTTSLPTLVPASGTLPTFALEVEGRSPGGLARTALEAVGVDRWSGAVDVKTTFSFPSSVGTIPQVPVKLSIIDQPIVSADPSLLFKAAGRTPSLRLPTTPGTVSVDSLGINDIVARYENGDPVLGLDAADDNASTFGIACTQLPGQDRVIHRFEVGTPTPTPTGTPTPTPTPVTPTPTPVTPTPTPLTPEPTDSLYPVGTPTVTIVDGRSAKVCWDPQRNAGVNTTRVAGLPASASRTELPNEGGLRCDLIQGLAPAQSYTLTIQASNPINTGNVATFRIDMFTVATPTPVTPTPVTPTPVTPTPVSPTPVTPTVATPTVITPTPPQCPPAPGETLISYGYAAAGSATLKTLVKGNLPLTGTIAAKLGVPSGCIVATLALNKSSANLTALGFLPVKADVVISPTEAVTGTLRESQLKVNAKVRIKLPKVSLAGVQIGGGANCQAKQISSIDLKSTQAKFLPTIGGPIAGSFSISDLAGCGALNGIISPLTAGKGNAIVLNLTPKN